MEKFRIKGILPINNFLSTNNYQKYTDLIYQKKFGDLIGIYAHIAPIPSVITLFEKNLVYSFRKKGYIFDLDNVKISINKKKRLRNLFFPQWEITLSDSTAKSDNESFSFITGTIFSYNGARNITYSKNCTLSFAEFLKNWIAFLKKPPKDFLNFPIITFSKNDKGKYQSKPYSKMWGQENLVITDDELHIINEDHQILNKKEVLIIESEEVKFFLNKVTAMKIIVSGGREYIIGRYFRGNCNPEETRVLKNALDKWLKS